MKKINLLLFFLFIFIANSFGQLNVQHGLNGQTLGEILSGENIQVSNASVSGNALQHGSFTFSGNGLQVTSGVILSTGNIHDAVGPNSSHNTSTSFGGPGNPLLTNLANSQTYDATVLEFDFEVQSDEIEFNFIFLSEEYNEYVGTTYNDVFAFYISGPGINGQENLAVVPGTTTPVSINTINNDSFWQFYHDNTNGNTNIEFDGFTTLMKAQKSGLQPCNTYTLKLMIADAGDGILDAGVLLQENSLIQPNISAAASTYSNNNIALEGCIEADFNFQIDTIVDYDVDIPIELAGTAINGVDYKYIDPIVTIPAGQTTASVIIQSYSDGMTEGQESIKLIYTPSPCEQPDTVDLFIDDFEPIEFTATTTGTNCNGSDDGEVLFNISGGFAPYTINLTDTLTGQTNTYTNNPIPNLNAGTYLVEIIDSYGCKAEDVVFGDIFNAGTTFLPTGTGVTYETSIEVTGFDDGELLESIDQFEQVSATMEHSYANDLSISLRAPDGTEVLLKAEGSGSIGSNPNNSCDMGEPVASGRIDEWNANNITPGIGYEYVWNTDPTYETMSYVVDNQLLPEHTYISTFGNELTDYYYPSGSFEPEGDLSDFIGTELNGTWTIIVTDFYILDNGYIFEWSLSLSSPQSDSIITIIEPNPPVVTSTTTNPDCGNSNGSIDVTVQEINPDSYLWSNGETTEDIFDVPAGQYNLLITADDGCEYDFDFNLSNSGNLNLSAITQDETCVDENDGYIDLSVNGGTPDFDYSWDNGQNTEDIYNLPPNDYTVTVTDQQNCSGIETFTINEAIPILIEGNITHENCGDHEGAINLNVSGGLQPYNFLWSNGETTQNIDELVQGDYTVTVTDANGCISQNTFTVINYVGNCIPDCDLEITNLVVSDEYCGQQNGSIDLTVFTSNSPYNVQWSNGQNSEDLNGLSAGTYTATITDAENCQIIQEVFINNQTSGLEIIDASVNNETCGNGQGSIDITLNGGALPYSYNWSNGENTEDLSNLNIGDYSVTVTDANGCSVSDNFFVNNDAGDLEVYWSNVVNETCGNSNGSIDIMVQGGNPFWNGEYDYQWSNGDFTKGIENLSAGTYYCVITDQDGCQITSDNFTVENDGSNIQLDYIDIDNEICSNAQGEIELEISGGTQPYSFLWSNGQTTQNIYNLTAGNYSATITDANDCSINTGSLTVINESGTLTLEDIVTVDEVCNNNLGEIDITVTGGSLPYNFNWNTGATTEDLTALSAGDYSCIITDNNGCQINVNTTIYNDNGAIAVENINVTNETCGSSDGAIDITITGASEPVMYNWNNGETTEDLTNIPAGDYQCLITDNIGCQTNAYATVYNDAGSLSLDNVIITNEQCGNANGSINLVVSGYATPFNFNWSNGQTTKDITNLQAGTYSCIITDNAGCTINAGPFTINNTSTTMLVDDVIISDETCGGSNGAIDITLSGGTEPIEYLWSNGATTQDISGITAGTYSVTITDDTDCSINKTYTVENNSGNLEITSYSTTNEICGNSNGSIDINVQGEQPFTFLWNNGETTEDISNLQAGTYYVTVTDNNNCETTSSNINIINDPGAFELENINVTDEYCNNSQGEIDVEVKNGTEPITYNWSNGETTQDLTNLSQGAYSCIALDANGCELNFNAVVHNLNGDLMVDSISVINETCGNANGAIDLTVSGSNTPITYLWNNGETSQDLTDITAGDYYCTITDSEGCYLTVNETVDDISGNFAIINYDIQNEHCNNQAGYIDITIAYGQQPYNILWSNGQTSEDIENLSAGTYTVTITDNIGCQIQQSFTIQNIPGSLAIDKAVITDEICGNGEGAIDITYSGANGTAYFNWSNGQTTEDLNNLHTGYYEIIITDDYTCSTSETFFVDNISGNFVVQDAIITDEYCGDGQGAIDLTITGGTEPYSFFWNNGSTSEDLNNLSAGIYFCEISDNTGCTIFFSDTVENITNGTSVALNQIINDQCTSASGSIDISPQGGVSPYTFLWNTGETTEDLNNITAGNYWVTITDNTDCSFTSDVFTVQNENVDMQITNIEITNDECGYGSPMGTIDFDVNPSGNYTYMLNNQQQNLPFTNLYGGEYIISALDGNCRVDDTVTVGTNGWFTVNIDSIENDVCGNNQGAVYISINASYPGNYSFYWSNGATTEDLLNVGAGTYSCEITDDYDCKQTIYAEVNNIVNFSASSEKIDATCNEDNGEIDLTIVPDGYYTFNWSNGETTEDIDSLSAGIYSCVVADEENCKFTISEEIFNNVNNLDIQADVQDDLCNQSIGSINLTISNAPMGYSVLWDNYQTTNYINNLSEGTYSVTITDLQYGCKQTESYFVSNQITFSVDDIITNSSCQTCDDGAIDLILDPATATYYFQWSNGETTEDIDSLLPGIYSVTITDQLGCVIDSSYTVEYDQVNIINNKGYSIIVYPNPAQEVLNIKYDFIEKSVAEFSILNITGQTINKFDITDKNGLKKIELDNFAAGIYFIKVKVNDFSKIIKFIKK